MYKICYKHTFLDKLNLPVEFSHINVVENLQKCNFHLKYRYIGFSSMLLLHFLQALKGYVVMFSVLIDLTILMITT